MKKVSSKVIAILLAMTLVFTMSGVAFADTGSDAAVNKAAVSAFDGEGLDGPEVVLKTKGKVTAKSEDMPALTIKTLATATTEYPAYDEWIFEPYTYVENVVTAPTTGWIWFDYAVTGTDSDYVDVYLFTPDVYSEFLQTGDIAFARENCIINASGSLPAGYAEEEACGLYATKGQQYILYMETPDTNAGDVTVDVCAVMYSSTQRTLPAYTNANQYMLTSGINKAGTGTSDIYYKVVPAKSGVMTVNLKAYSNVATTGTVTLYNANKVKVSNAVQYKSSKTATKAYFGVTKGKTYYIRVQNCGDANGYYYSYYGIRYGVAAATDRSINTTGKALKLTRGGSGYSTLFTANNATGIDYYKIYVPTKRTTKFSVDTTKMRSGTVKVRVYKNGKQVGSTQTINPSDTTSTFTITYGTTTGKASKGTYYIKLTKSEKASGLYKIRYIQ